MRRSIAQKNMLVLIFSFIPFMMGIGYSVYTSSERSYLSKAINMSGAQRMRTMLLGNYAQQIHYAYINGHDGTLERNIIERELATYKQFFKALQHGDADQHIIENPFPHIAHSLALMDDAVNQYVANVEHILKNPRHAEAVHRIISTALAIRDDFHEVTEQYQSMNDLMIRRQKAVDISMLVFAALVTMSGLFLTRKIRVQEQRLFAATEEAAAIRAKNDFLANQNEQLAKEVQYRLETEKALRISEEKFRMVADNVPGVVYLCANDERWSMLYLNDKVELLTGYPKEEFLENRISFADIYHPDDRVGVQEEIDLALSRKEPFHIQFRFRHKNGEWKWAEESGVGVYENNRISMLEGVVMDITERKRAEAEMERLNEQMREAMSVEAHQAGKLETATGILHDIGNAITGLGAVFVDYREGDA